MEKITLSDFLKLERKALAGKVFCFPTDTVYGLAALYGDQEGIKKIYELKGRSFTKPLANLCSGIEQITELGIQIPKFALELMKKHWPGPLTLILKGPEGKVSFRMPDSEIALKSSIGFPCCPQPRSMKAGNRK